MSKIFSQTSEKASKRPVQAQNVQNLMPKMRPFAKQAPMYRPMILVLQITCVLASFHTLRAQPESKWIREKSVRSALQTLSADAMMGRKPGTPGMEKAAAFLETAFRKAGLQPLAGATGFRQSFQTLKARVTKQTVSVNGRPADPQEVIIWPVTTTVRLRMDAMTIIPVGSGERLGQVISEASKSGKDVLIVADTAHRRTFLRYLSYSPERLSGGGNICILISDSPITRFEVDAEADLEHIPYQNIAGMIPGQSRASEYVLFSAHYDHIGTGKPVADDSIFNGANDDASGTVAVTTLARYFKKAGKNARTLVFVAFTAEESGGYGSTYFSSRWPVDSIVAMFNIEMIGTQSKWGRNSAFITGFDKSDFGEILQRQLEGTDFRFYPDPYPAQDLFYRSDNATLARLGVPAHTISTSKMDNEPYYHTVDDELSTLDTQNMTAIIRAIALSSKGIVEGSQTPRRVEKSAVRR